MVRTTHVAMAGWGSRACENGRRSASCQNPEYTTRFDNGGYGMQYGGCRVGRVSLPCIIASAALASA